MFTIGEVLKADGDADQKTLVPPPRPETNVATLLTHGGVVVVVGGRNSNFSEVQLRDPRFVFWHSTDPKAFFRAIPSNARGLFFVGGFIGTQDEKRIRKQASDRGIFVPPGYLTTGAIKTILDKIRAGGDWIKEKAADPVPVMPVSAKPPMTQTTTPIPAAAPPKEEPVVKRALRAPVRGELKRFVQQHGDPLERPSVEAKRLMPLLEEQGLRSTFLSVENTLRMYVTQRPKKSRGPYVNETVVPPRAAPPAPPVVVAATPPPMDAAPVAQTSDPVLAQIDAAMQVASDLRVSADLLMESLTKIKADVHALRKAKQRLASAAREFLD